MSPTALSRVLLACVLFACVLLVTCGSAVSAAEPKRPNILLIFSDDLAYQAISAYGDPRKLLQTPQMDSLAASGMRFDRCLVTNSICGPSRAVTLTGKYSHLNGFYNNSNSRFNGAQETFPKLLQRAGYATALIGKWHLVSDPTGFDHWDILPGQGVYYDPPMIANGQRSKRTGYTTEILTDLSIDWLKQRDNSKPFLLMLQHKAPHRPWEPAIQDLGWDHDRFYPEPPTLFDDHRGHSRAVAEAAMSLSDHFTPVDAKLTPFSGGNAEQKRAWEAFYGPRNQEFEKRKLSGEELVRWRYNRYLHDYLACVKAIDNSIGRVLQTLHEMGEADNTLVVCTSDQGFYLGEHGWFDKRWIFEESLRTPLLIRWPGVVQPGQVNKDIVSLIDLPETFLEAAGIPVPTDMQGSSLIPLLKGETPANWRKSFYYHYYEYPAPHQVRPHYGVVTDRYKLFHFYQSDLDEWELLDREQDPLEQRNFYNDPAAAETIVALKAELRRLREELKDTDQPPRAAHGNKPFPTENTGRN
ncbi:sulfatase family protein [Planctomicrobium sp. SH664]|uniref:sulfatase family protein n=1 Tax=Planctomicrobium sp. SH664 TaxID=3448125 RepID=UPI003F5B6422